jgi:hypothetical protein
VHDAEHGNVGGHRGVPFASFQILGRGSPLQDDLFHARVERETVVAPDAQKVPPSVARRLFTIDADNVHNAGQVGWDGLAGNAHGQRGPGGGHVFRRLGRFFANGTAGVVRDEFLEAVPMNGVAAGHFVRGKATAEQIFLTNGTVAHVLATLAVVIVKQVNVNAHAAIVTVTKIVGAAHAAKAAVGTVVRFVFAGHPQVANVAVILAKLNAAANAVVPDICT